MEPHRPLLIHPGAIGDLIRLTAVTRTLSERWGAPCDLVARHPAAADVFAGLSSLGEIRRWPSRRRPYHLDPVQWRLARWLRRRPAGPVYLFEERVHRIVPWRSQTRMEWLLGRAGVPPGRRVVARHHPRGLFEPFGAYGQRLAALDPTAIQGPLPSSAPPVAPLPELAVSATELADCRRWMAQRELAAGQPVLLQIGSRRIDRGRWPNACWRELTERILTLRPTARILLLGSRAERRQTAELAAECDDPRILDAAGELPLRRLFALLSLSDSCISLDTGPAHAAAAVACPLVVLAGHADPRRNRPTGGGQVRLVTAWPRQRWPDTPQRWVAEHDPSEIPVAAVFDAWESLISPPVPPPHKPIAAAT